MKIATSDVANPTVTSSSWPIRLIQSIPSSYTIWNNSGTYYAETNLAGGTDHTDTDIGALVNTCLADLSAGGKIHIRQNSSAYTMASQGTFETYGYGIRFGTGAGDTNNYIILEGEGNGTVLKLTSANCRMICAHYGDSLIIRDMKLDGDNKNIGGSTADALLTFTGGNTTNNVCQNLQIVNGNKADALGVSNGLGNSFSNIYASGNAHGIALNHSSRNRVYSCEVLSGDGVGLLITGNSYDNTATQVLSHNNAQDGIQISKSEGFTPHRNRIINCSSWLNTWSGISLYSTGDNLIEGNHCFDNAGSGVYLNDDAATACTLNIIQGNLLYDDQLVPTQDYGIEAIANSDYNTYKNNHCYANVNTAYSFVGFNNTYDAIVRTATSVDLSGGATTLIAFHPETACHLARAMLLYTEASSADAGITLEVGKESDRDYYYTGASETDKAQWYTKWITLLKNDIAAGDTVTFYSPGTKVGTGEVMLIIDYCTGA